MALAVSEQRTLLEELDARQNELLAELDALNDRIESLLKEATERPAEGPAYAPTAVAEAA